MRFPARGNVVCDLVYPLTVVGNIYASGNSDPCKIDFICLGKVQILACSQNRRCCSRGPRLAWQTRSKSISKEQILRDSNLQFERWCYAPKEGADNSSRLPMQEKHNIDVNSSRMQGSQIPVLVSFPIIKLLAYRFSSRSSIPSSSHQYCISRVRYSQGEEVHQR